jgi:hypothetical protein
MQDRIATNFIDGSFSRRRPGCGRRLSEQATRESQRTRNEIEALLDRCAAGLWDGALDRIAGCYGHTTGAEACWVRKMIAAFGCTVSAAPRVPLWSRWALSIEKTVVRPGVGV